MSAIIKGTNVEETAKKLSNANFKTTMILPSVVGYAIGGQRDGYAAIRKSKGKIDAETIRTEIEKHLKSTGEENPGKLVDATFDGINDAKRVLIEIYEKYLVSKY